MVNISGGMEGEFKNQIDIHMRTYYLPDISNVLTGKGKRGTDWAASARQASISWQGVCS
jgi:hypothetical protein